MFKSSRKAFPTVTSSFEAPPIFKESLSEGRELIKPEERFCEEALEDSYYRSLITLSLGKEFSEREVLTKTDVNRFTLLYGTDAKTVRVNTYYGILPLKKRGCSWESRQSSVLRNVYRSNADKMFERLELCDFSQDYFNAGTIELVDIPYKTVDYLEFSSAAALVDKKPHKKKSHNSGDAVYFRDFYRNGKRGMLFGVFDASGNNTSPDYRTASLLVSLFKKFFRQEFFSGDAKDIRNFFFPFFNHTKQNLAPNSGASFSIGLVYSDCLYYFNVGDCRIYTCSFYPEITAKKITVDNEVSGLGKAKPVYQNAGEISLKDVDFILVATEGFWSNLPLKVKKNLIVDSSCEKTLQEILSSHNSKDPKQILEYLYDYSRANMKLRGEISYNNLVIRPNPQDIALLGFSV